MMQPEARQILVAAREEFHSRGKSGVREIEYDDDAYRWRFRAVHRGVECEFEATSSLILLTVVAHDVVVELDARKSELDDFLLLLDNEPLFYCESRIGKATMSAWLEFESGRSFPQNAGSLLDRLVSAFPMYSVSRVPILE